MESSDNFFNKFCEGCEAIFSRWTAFRMALDNNPKILTYILDDGETIEINNFLELLYEDMFNTIKKDKLGHNFVVDKVADCLYTFIGDYFSIELDDESDKEIAEIIVTLYYELKESKYILLNDLKSKFNKNVTKYSIDFPITGKQQIDLDKIKNDEEDEEGSLSSCEEKEEEEDDKKDKNNNNKNNKMDEEDEDGFKVYRKGKGF